MNSIDIVVPCYRYGRYLRDCVHSVQTQGACDWRVLILDDASPDETPEVGEALAREDARITYRRHAVNRGHIATYNEGIDWIRAEHMLLLSADDHLLPGALDRALALMQAHPDVGLCFGEAIELHDDGSTRSIRVDVDTAGEPSIVISGEDFVRLCIEAGANNVVPTPTAIVRTRLLKQLGGYRADLPHSGDLELWLRLAAHAPVGFVKADLAVYRRHCANMSLGYAQDEGLADLQQRRLAVDAFVQTCRPVLASADRLHQALLQQLAHQAVQAASSAFNDNRMALSQRLCDLAVSAWPGVQHGAPWRALACKRRIGLRLSGALLPAVSRIRAVTAWIRH
ncbi:glycosyl transferase family 2 [Leptothrix cholodnii SP-6]|uniref:Glycosyl transferase family 2 n=1 Tax=Leptothrix cholodnii (strain ATCC 51168 / LMG 8142 / SP-6) TaxID=395495 RepID=B1Y724_LEPCP|nr:glycosyltransferase [Leptothrix cholodnii]ACB33651.1 glycosyl transferase family 2 [Leptothrix cholodnii SP-6]